MSGRGRGGISSEFPAPIVISTTTLTWGNLRAALGDTAGRLIVSGTRQGSLFTPHPIPSVPFWPMHLEGQALAIGAAAVASAAMTLNREHCLWAEQRCWIRIGAGAAALDFPMPAGAVFVYTPTAAGNATISVIQMAALGGNLYIGQSEQT